MKQFAKLTDNQKGFIKTKVLQLETPEKVAQFYPVTGKKACTVNRYANWAAKRLLKPEQLVALTEINE